MTSLMDKIKCLAAAYAPLDGMNDAGVSCGIYMTYQGAETVPTDQNTEKTGSDLHHHAAPCAGLRGQRGRGG